MSKKNIYDNKLKKLLSLEKTYLLCLPDTLNFNVFAASTDQIFDYQLYQLPLL